MYFKICCLPEGSAVEQRWIAQAIDAIRATEAVRANAKMRHKPVPNTFTSVVEITEGEYRRLKAEIIT